jgi:hypothetical protein
MGDESITDIRRPINSFAKVSKDPQLVLVFAL